MQRQRKIIQSVIYVVIEQLKADCRLYKDLFGEARVKFLYYRKVETVRKPTVTNDTNEMPLQSEVREAHLFSFQPISKSFDLDRVEDRQRYVELSKALELGSLFDPITKDKQNSYVIWTFPVTIDHLGAYIKLVAKLEETNKRLILLIPNAADANKLMEHSVVADIHKDYIDKKIVYVSADVKQAFLAAN